MATIDYPGVIAIHDSGDLDDGSGFLGDGKTLRRDADDDEPPDDATKLDE